MAAVWYFWRTKFDGPKRQVRQGLITGLLAGSNNWFCLEGLTWFVKVSKLGKGAVESENSYHGAMIYNAKQKEISLFKYVIFYTNATVKHCITRPYAGCMHSTPNQLSLPYYGLHIAGNE